MQSQKDSDNSLIIRFGQEELVIRRRYEVLSIINDFFIAIWFLVGSILFLFPEAEHTAVWLFILGSFQFLVRPSLRLAQHIHLERIPADSTNM